MRSNEVYNLLRPGILLVLILAAGNLYPQSEVAVEETQSTQALHALWDSLLKAHVLEDGMVDYKGFLKTEKSLQQYLDKLSKNPPTTQWSREARLAYFINLYNAGTIALILENYPVKSIRDIKRPWGKKWISVGEQMYSLGDIEHKILRKMGDPRIHFAINCASYSCPSLPKYAFTEGGVQNQLKQAALDFIGDPNRNSITPEKAEVSKIFKWFRSDFETGGRSLVAYLNGFLNTPIPAETPIGFLPYDWSLNDSAR